MDNQWLLLGTNFCLLAVVSIMTLRFNQQQKLGSQISFQKPPIDPVIEDLYQSINYALKLNHPQLIVTVDEVPLPLFVAFYKGLERLGIKTDLRCKYFKDNSYSEYLILDLKNYHGPRHKPLQPLMLWPKAEELREVMSYNKPEIGPQVANFSSVPFPKKVSSANYTNSENNVVDFLAYKQQRRR